MQDPYQDTVLLSRKDLMKIMRMSGDTLTRFLKEEKSFPKPFMAGTTKDRGGTRLRWYKDEVYEWLITRKSQRVSPVDDEKPATQ